MADKAVIAAVLTLALSGALASVAHADEPTTSTTVPLVDRNLWGPQPVHKSFEWDAGKSRWGVKLDMDQAPGRSSNWQNVQAGAYFKLTPSLSVGGAVSVRDQLMTPAQQTNPQGPPGVTSNSPRVRLETAFKF